MGTYVYANSFVLVDSWAHEDVVVICMIRQTMIVCLNKNCFVYPSMYMSVGTNVHNHVHSSTDEYAHDHAHDSVHNCVLNHAHDWVHHYVRKWIFCSAYKCVSHAAMEI